MTLFFSLSPISQQPLGRFGPNLVGRWVLFVPAACPEEFSGTARQNGTNFSMCIHDHHPLILQQEECQGHKVKVTMSRKLIFGEGVCERGS